jgi:hypothetical protein
MATVTICPPGEHRRDLGFDQTIFAGRRPWNLAAVGLDYGGLQKCSIRRITDLRQGRRRPIPDWAYNDLKFRDVVVRYLECRYFQRDCSGDLKTRLHRCTVAAASQASALKKRLENSIAKYIDLCTLGKSSAKSRKELRRCIQAADSELAFHLRAPELTAAILYMWFRQGLDSPSIAETIGLSPVAVRQVVHRACVRAVQKPDCFERPKKEKERQSNPE